MTAFEFVSINPFVGTNLRRPSGEDLQLTALRRKDGGGQTVTLFGPGKHYDRITSGMDSDHIKNSASPILRSQSGETILCLLAWSSGQSPAGVCTKSDGKQIDVRFD